MLGKDPILRLSQHTAVLTAISSCLLYSAASNIHTGEGVAIKKVTNVFSKKILAKRALREIKLLQHFRGHRNVSSRRQVCVRGADRADRDMQITCLYDMDIPRPENFNETYLYEGEDMLLHVPVIKMSLLTFYSRTDGV